MKKERNYYFRDYVPIIVGLVILLVLGYALYFVINYVKQPDLIKAPEGMIDAKYKEKKVDISASTCPKVNLASYKEKADKITVDYEYKDIVDEEKTVIDSFMGKDEELIETTTKLPFLNIKGIEDGLYIVLTGDVDKNANEKITKDDLVDGVKTYECPYSEKLITYTIKVYVNVTGCRDVLIRKFTMALPVYNTFSNQLRCAKYPGFKYCKEYLLEDMPSYTKFEYEYSKYLKDVERGKVTTQKTTSFAQAIIDADIFEKDEEHKEAVKKIEEELKKQREEQKKKENKAKIKKYLIIGGVVLGSLLIIVVGFIVIKKRRGNLR